MVEFVVLDRSKRLLFVSCGIGCLGLGMIGVFLPGLPTVPFILLAAFFFSKSSERFYQYLLNHPSFGQSIRDWEDSWAIRLKAKLLASLTIALSFAILLIWIAKSLELRAVLLLIATGVLLFIWSRPSSRKPH